jgi:hypothetical protein
VDSETLSGRCYLRRALKADVRAALPFHGAIQRQSTVSAGLPASRSLSGMGGSRRGLKHRLGGTFYLIAGDLMPADAGLSLRTSP